MDNTKKERFYTVYVNMKNIYECKAKHRNQYLFLLNLRQ